jgi:hypothetical protein
MSREFELCLKQAELIVKSYRDQAPEGYDVYNYQAVGIIVAVLAVAGAAVSATASYQQGKTQRKIGEYNANLAKNQAVAARYAAEAQAQKVRERAKRLQASQVVGASKSGLTLSGSVSDVMYDSSVESEIDALTSLYKGQRGAESGYAEAALERYRGRSAQLQGNLAAAGTLLEGGSSAVDAYYSYKPKNYPTING